MDELREIEIINEKLEAAKKKYLLWSAAEKVLVIIFSILIYSVCVLAELPTTLIMSSLLYVFLTTIWLLDE